MPSTTSESMLMHEACNPKQTNRLCQLITKPDGPPPHLLTYFQPKAEKRVLAGTDYLNQAASIEYRVALMECSSGYTPGVLDFACKILFSRLDITAGRRLKPGWSQAKACCSPKRPGCSPMQSEPARLCRTVSPSVLRLQAIASVVLIFEWIQ